MTQLQTYAGLLAQIKTRIRTAQLQASLSVNADLIRLYWQIGALLDARQASEGWGAQVIPRLARDLRNELPEHKGFSERNLNRMLAFHREYADSPEFLPQPVAKTGAGPDEPARSTEEPLQAIAPAPNAPLTSLPWGHHVLLMERVKDQAVRRWYIAQAVSHGWSRNVLKLQIDSQAHVRQGKLTSNFAARLPPPQSDLAQQSLKDPYIFDFLTLDADFRERELEAGLVRHLEKFLLELGQGFAFVGRQYPLAVGENDFYIDLLFYHLKLRCFVVIELKRGEFKPEYAGKLNFYCNVVDDRLRHQTDAPTIGLMLCQDKDSLLAEYALRGIDKPIGIASYELTRSLPPALQSALPSIEAIEAELSTLGASNE